MSTINMLQHVYRSREAPSASRRFLFEKNDQIIGTELGENDRQYLRDTLLRATYYSRFLYSCVCNCIVIK